MLRAAKEGHGVINLDVIGYPHARPDGPDAVNDGLSGLGKGWIQSASDSGRIDHIQAVEPHRSLQVARADQIGLMCLVRQKRRQGAIAGLFRGRCAFHCDFGFTFDGNG